MALIKMMAAPNTRMHASVKGVEKAWEDENRGADNEENNALIAMEVANAQQQKKMRSMSSRGRRRWADAVSGTQVLEGKSDKRGEGDAAVLDASLGAQVTEASEHVIESALHSSSAIVDDCSSVLKDGRMW